jgi:cell division septum initiation protein DivIVA
MVFGWGKKKEDTQITENIQHTTIRLSEIEKIIQQLKQQKQEFVVQRTKPLFGQIQKEMSLIYKIISHLEDDSLKVEDIDKTLRNLVVRSKSEVIETVSKESQKTLPQITSYDDVVNASVIAGHVLKKIGDVLGKNSRVIHVFAKKYAQDLKTHLGLIATNHQTISRQMNDLISFDLSASEIRGMSEKIVRMGNDLSEKTQHLKKLSEFQNECVRTIDVTEKKIGSLRSSPEFAKFLELQQEIKQVGLQQDSLKKEMEDEFSKISRPLGKYVYVTSLEKPHKLILERLISNPFDVVLPENKESIITVLESCMKGIISGNVSVKETDKSVDQVTHLISLIDGFIARKNDLKSQAQKLEEKLGIFDSKHLADLEKLLEKAKSDKTDAESKIQKLESELDSDKAQKQDLVEELQVSLERLSGTKYAITL